MTERYQFKLASIESNNDNTEIVKYYSIVYYLLCTTVQKAIKIWKEDM